MESRGKFRGYGEGSNRGVPANAPYTSRIIIYFLDISAIYSNSHFPKFFS